MKHAITITTDFGDNFASSQLKAVIASLGYFDTLIENHGVPPFAINAGAFEILTLSRFSPSGAIHVGVVDPGVGSTRRGIILQTNHFYFVGPDNGLLYAAASRDTIVNAWSIQESSISERISNTFHGRDVFIKVAVYLAHGKQPKDFGSESININSLQTLTFQIGEVLHIDHYGNVKIHFTSTIQPGATLSIQRGDDCFSIPFVKTFSDVPSGNPLALLGSSATLEIAMNMGNAAQHLNLSVGNILKVEI